MLHSAARNVGQAVVFFLLQRNTNHPWRDEVEVASSCWARSTPRARNTRTCGNSSSRCAAGLADKIEQIIINQKRCGGAQVAPQHELVTVNVGTVGSTQLFPVNYEAAQVR
jgi:UDP-N-acetylenolpyruvoylglucosamine reductase